MAKRSKKSGKKINITLVRSPIGFSQRQKRTIRALGLRRVNQTVEHVDGPEIRGMLEKVGHLVKIEE